MAKGRTIAAGAFFGIGLFFALVALLGVVQPRAEEQQRFAALGIGLLGGVPAFLLGSSLIAQDQALKQEQKRDRIQKAFYTLLKEGQGRINVLRFSMEANLSGSEAKAFLDQQAREFNASFNVSEEGKILYYFDGDFPALPASKAHDVVLESFPWNHREAVARVIQDQTGIERSVVKHLLKVAERSHPVTIVADVTEARADTLRHALEVYGAQVAIVPRPNSPRSNSHDW